MDLEEGVASGHFSESEIKAKYPKFLLNLLLGVGGGGGPKISLCPTSGS